MFRINHEHQQFITVNTSNMNTSMNTEWYFLTFLLSIPGCASQKLSLIISQCLTTTLLCGPPVAPPLPFTSCKCRSQNLAKKRKYQNEYEATKQLFYIFLHKAYNIIREPRGNVLQIAMKKCWVKKYSKDVLEAPQTNNQLRFY